MSSLRAEMDFNQTEGLELGLGTPFLSAPAHSGRWALWDLVLWMPLALVAGAAQVIIVSAKGRQPTHLE